MNCGRQSHFTKNCKRKKPGLVTNQLKGTKTPQDTKELKGTKGYMLKHFVFCYDNRCPIHKEAKYGASYWPQELSLDQFKGTKEEEQDCLNKLD